MQQILTKRQFAERIGKSVRHVERLIGAGEGPPTISLGLRAVGIGADDADAWLKSRRVTPPGWEDDETSDAPEPHPKAKSRRKAADTSKAGAA